MPEKFDWAVWIKQQSTQKAIVAVLAAFGVAIDPERMDIIMAGFLALYGILAAFRDKI